MRRRRGEATGAHGGGQPDKRNGRGAAPTNLPAVTAEPTLDLFARWREQVVVALGAARAELDALNVFPVPDADTGTNVYLTVESAAQAAADAAATGSDITEVGRAFVDGALRGARGNSGVIVSQLLRVSVPLLLAGNPVGDPRTPGQLYARVLRSAAEAAWAAVGDPVEGTILTVARAAAEGAEAAAGRDASLPAVLRAATTAADDALARTPDQLEPLRRAGVVDAGGRALVVLLDTTERVLTGRVTPQASHPRRMLPVPIRPIDDQPSSTGPAYEVMYLLDAPDDTIPALRAALGPLGDSLAVVGGEGLWNVHVHVDDVGAAIEVGTSVGRPHRILVTHFADQVDAPLTRPRRGRAVVLTAAGPGLAALFRSAGAEVVESAHGRRTRAHELLAAVVGAANGPVGEAVLLPNDRSAVAGAEAAAHQAREQGVRVAVIPTTAQVQGIAALAVHDPGRSFDDDVVQMSAAAGQTRHGAVTIALGQAMTTAGPCEPGDVLGVVDGDFALVGKDVASIGAQVVDRLLGGSGELVTIVTGADLADGVAGQIERRVIAGRPDIDVQVYDGGQSRYLLLLAVE